MADFSNGVWRTVAGRHIFIRNGQSLSSAMKKSGKFKNATKNKKTTNRIKEEVANQKANKLANENIELYKKHGGFNLDTGNEKANAENREAWEKWLKNKDKLHKYKDESRKAGETWRNEDKKSNGWKSEEGGVTRKETKDGTNYIQGVKKADGSTEYTRTDYDKKGNELSSKTYKSLDEAKAGGSKNATYSWSKDEEGTTYGYKNQYGTTLNQLQIDDEAKEYRVGSFTMKNDKTTTRKDFNSKVEELENAGYKKVDYWSKRKGTGSNTSNIKSEKSTSDYMNEKIRSRGKTKDIDDLPKKVEIKTQGTSNRKEVSENIQAHILEYYDSPDDFIQQMDAMDYLPTKWKAGEEIARGGSYLIYNGDMADFLNDLKINPKGKSFSDEKAFNTYTSLIGRESAKLYTRIQRNAYNKYKKEHPLTQMSFEDFQKMNKK